jgi:hypothetical protein
MYVCPKGMHQENAEHQLDLAQLSLIQLQLKQEKDETKKDSIPNA